MRLVAFVGVLALIIGTSVSLASADDRAPAKTVAARSADSTPTPTPVVARVTAGPKASAAKESGASKESIAPKESAAPKVDAADADAEAAPDAAAAADADTGDALAADPSASAGTASGELPQAGLPLTGDVHVRWLMLGGAMLVLLGMLVQVAGQPLPAPARR
ncbi:MAG: hypothetical protein JWL76_1531 [Thermoleophilia bacterium]|nr:hypothetical protein [Thermoleophilia bacterium]